MPDYTPDWNFSLNAAPAYRHLLVSYEADGFDTCVAYQDKTRAWIQTDNSPVPGEVYAWASMPRAAPRAAA